MTGREEMNWFAVQSRPNQEALAGANLARLAIDVFLPRVRVEQKVCGVRRKITKPLFPGYLFARFSPAAHLSSIRYTRGVAAVLSAGEEPVAIELEIVQEIKSRVADDGFVELLSPRWSEGDRVEISDGPLQGLMGRVEREMDDAGRVAILLEALSARVVMDGWVLSLAAN
jgi:transcriptional antiterminator RfaH